MFGQDNVQPSQTPNQTNTTNPVSQPDDSQPSSDLDLSTLASSDSSQDSVSPGRMIAPPEQPQVNSMTNTNTLMPPQAAPIEPEMPAPTDAPMVNDLMEIKSKALKELTPLVDHLDQPPLDKFRTLMMTIQAGDDKELIPKAYAAAQKIENNTDRAQALLDVINEINYFSQNS